MAALPEIKPNGYLSQGGCTWTYSTVGFYQDIDEGYSAYNDADYIQAAQNGSGYIWLDLDAMPSDFATMSTLTISMRCGLTGSRQNDTYIIYAQLFRSDGTTALTAERQVAQLYSTNFSSYSGLAFSSLDTAANKTVWDGARIRLRVTWSVSGQPDAASIQVAAFSLFGTYAATGTAYQRTASAAATTSASATRARARARTATAAAVSTTAVTSQKAGGGTAYQRSATAAAVSTATATGDAHRVTPGCVAEYVAAYAKGEGEFGYDTTYNLWNGDYESGNSDLCWWSLAESGTVTKLSVYLRNTDTGHTAANVKAAIYDDNGSGGAAGSLLAISPEVTVPDNAAAGWVDFELSTPVALAAGTYWLGIFGEDGSCDGLAWAYDSGVSGHNVYWRANPADYENPPDPYNGTLSGASYGFNILATYECAYPGNNTDPTSTWADLMDGYDGALQTFAYTTDSGWVGNGTAADPYALEHDGASDYTSTASPPLTDLHDADGWAVEQWLRCSGSAVQCSFSFFDTGDADLCVQTILNRYSANDGRIWFGWWNDAGAGCVFEGGTTDWRDGDYHHVVMTYNGSTAALYIDGVARGTPPAVPDNPSTPNGFDIGRDHYGTTTGNYWQDRIATTRVYPHGLTADEVAENYAAGVRAASRVKSRSATAAAVSTTAVTSQKGAGGTAYQRTATAAATATTAATRALVARRTAQAAATTATSASANGRRARTAQADAATTAQASGAKLAQRTAQADAQASASASGQKLAQRTASAAAQATAAAQAAKLAQRSAQADAQATTSATKAKLAQRTASAAAQAGTSVESQKWSPGGTTYQRTASAAATTSASATKALVARRSATAAASTATNVSAARQRARAAQADAAAATTATGRKIAQRAAQADAAASTAAQAAKLAQRSATAAAVSTATATGQASGPGGTTYQRTASAAAVSTATASAAKVAARTAQAAATTSASADPRRAAQRTALAQAVSTASASGQRAAVRSASAAASTSAVASVGRARGRTASAAAQATTAVVYGVVRARTASAAAVTTAVAVGIRPVDVLPSITMGAFGPLAKARLRDTGPGDGAFYAGLRCGTLEAMTDAEVME